MEKLFNIENYDMCHSLIKLLLPKLYRSGVYEITEEELGRKLYYYSIKPEFKGLFDKIQKIDNEDRLNISNAIYCEKYLSEGIKTNTNYPGKLILSYSDYLDIGLREKHFTEAGLKLVNTIVEELATTFKVESNSKNTLNIYDIDPNSQYSLVTSVYYNTRINSELITDGCINYLGDKKYITDKILENPCENGKTLSLCGAQTRDIKVRHASYVGIVGTLTDIERDFQFYKNIRVYTNIRDLDKLQEIVDIVNAEHGQDNLFVNDKPYVRKITLNNNN